MKTNLMISRLLVSTLALLGSQAAFALPTSSVSLQVSSASVSSGTAVTLSATVTSSGAPVFPGQVLFCDATATSCTGAALLATAQVTSTGTASVKLVLGPGSHSVKAVFPGTSSRLTAASTASSVAVTGQQPSITALSSQGTAGSYELDAIVGYNGVAAVGTPESVSFIDLTNKNLSLGTGTLTGLTAPAYTFSAFTGSPVSSGKIPSRVAIADVDGDGIPDMIVTNLGDSTVSVLRGNGTGGFTPVAGSPYAVGGSATGVAVGDFNDDGFPDFAVTNATAGTVVLFLNKGNGTFAAGAILTAGSGPQAITVGDFNFDGNADIAVANVYSSSVTVLLGDGTGHFLPASGSPIAVGNNPMALASADLNGDGYTDLAVANTSDATVSVLLGRGDGTFQAMTSSPFAVGGAPESMAVADLNGDGKLDLSVAGSTDNSLTVLLNTGTTFSSAGTYQSGASPEAVTAGDLNGDGKLDLLVTNFNDSTATVLTGKGDGTFTVSTQSPLQSFDGPGGTVLADFNGDGTLDAAVANAGDAAVSVRALKAYQTAAAKLTSVAIPGSGTHQVEATYAGDTNYVASVSAPITLTASMIATASTLAVSPTATVMYGQTVQLTESINPSSASNYTATGTGNFTNGGAALGSGSVSNGQALLSVNNLSVGPHSLGASYSGDTIFSGSTAVAASLTVTQATTTTTLTSSAGTVTSGGVILQATVAPTTSGVPTGTVSFYDNGSTTALGQATLVNGVASFQASTLSAGNNSFIAVYSGDTNYLTSTSQPAPVNNVDFTITASTTAQTVVPGQSTTFSFNVAPTSGTFDAPITFSVSGLPNGSTATFLPASVTPHGATVQTTMTVTTSLQASLEQNRHGVELACVGLLFLLPFSRQRARFLRSKAGKGLLVAAIGFLALGGLSALTGCSSGNGYQQIPSANYTLTVTATSGTIVHTSKVTLNLQ